MMASNDMVSTVMYWIIWDLADCDLDEEVSVGFIPRWIWKGYRGYL